MQALKDLLYKMADDALVIGHRNSEWTGIGPLLEEDLAFSSMAQDKVGHAQALYKIVHDLGEAYPDTLGFKRSAKEFRNCQFVELPIGEYDFSLARHFLFDHAELLRYEMLVNSSFQPLAAMARKAKGEIKYHVFHADSWLKQLANGNEESKARMQSALNFAWHYALGIFETGAFEEELKSQNIFAGEEALKTEWLKRISAIIEGVGLNIPQTAETKIALGGRKGFHTEFLQPLLTEMTEVMNVDPSAEW